MPNGFKLLQKRYLKKKVHSSLISLAKQTLFYSTMSCKKNSFLFLTSSSSLKFSCENIFEWNSRRWVFVMHYAHMSSPGASFIKIRYNDHLSFFSLSSLLYAKHIINLRPKKAFVFSPVNLYLLFCEDHQLHDPSRMRSRVIIFWCVKIFRSSFLFVSYCSTQVVSSENRFG